MATQDATDLGANTMLNALGTGGNIYMGLSNTLPNKDGSGSPAFNITEPTTSYARPNVPFSTAASRKRSNTAVANFISGGGNATTNQGFFQYATFHSAATPGANRYAWTALSQPVSWVSGLPVTIAIGDASLEFETS